ncbi:MAG: hypothetical protein EAZ32_01440 [Cytophagia bacterium]|nr:MAG: hypothetical protein EAZ46_00805 [Runella sp.]TAG22918.1 MAG: hypothetical protein EAZ38_03915 [Cytophagales bacterium]TAG41973.1 MAG: hypothetical protein EAZ32_01440 [Cytophagia bacterium]TAG51727.1 MAG: hypothetical protein EAZ29_08960 [Runella slithyformis]TAG78018.1 MAG: hypothetical protein EAZ22_14545 [Cytophagales bacterium]
MPIFYFREGCQKLLLLYSNLTFTAMRFFFASVLFVGLGWLVTSCEVCGINSEPRVQISFSNSSTNPTNRFPFFRKISIVGASQEFTESTRESSSLSLPLNLNANSTTYILEQALRTDTLTVFYDKVVENKSTKCGYVLDIKQPTVGPSIKTTFKSSSIFYEPYYSLSGRSGGIFVNVLL